MVISFLIRLKNIQNSFVLWSHGSFYGKKKKKKNTQQYVNGFVISFLNFNYHSSHLVTSFAQIGIVTVRNRN